MMLVISSGIKKALDQVLWIYYPVFLNNSKVLALLNLINKVNVMHFIYID